MHASYKNTNELLTLPDLLLFPPFHPQDHYDIKVTCHTLLIRLASLEPDLVRLAGMGYPRLPCPMGFLAGWPVLCACD